MNVLIVNSQDPVCGVHQYGKNLCEILQGSHKHAYTHYTFNDFATLKLSARYFDLIIINWHEKLFPWLNNESIVELKVPVAIVGGHDCYPPFENSVHTIDCTSCNEPTSKSTPIPRPVRDFYPLSDPERITIGSCGFNFSSKNFQHVATIVADSFEDALIRLHISIHPGGESIRAIEATIQQQLWALKKPNIDVEISSEFLSDEDLIAFLSENTTNVFLYPPFAGQARGLSSTIDKALASRKPFGLSESSMYRHLAGEKRFFLTNYNLAQIIDFGTDHIKPFWSAHSEKRLIEVVDGIVDKLT
jgi:hypothetical protein